MAKYGRKARSKVKRALHKRKRGTLKSGRSGARVKSRKQAIAIGAEVATTAGKLPLKAVIHAVGPRFGEGDEEKKLAQALSSAFALAAEQGWQAVAFPAVSAGIFAVPLDICARAYLTAARASLQTGPLGKLRLCLRDKPVIDAVLRELKF